MISACFGGFIIGIIIGTRVRFPWCMPVSVIASLPFTLFCLWYKLP